MATTYYDVLGVGPQASAAEIRRAYRRLVLLTHPDRTPDPTAHARYLLINEAYETVGNPQRRQRYDAQLVRPTAPSAMPHPDPAMRRRNRPRHSSPVRPRPTQPVPLHVQYAAQFARLARWLRLLAGASLLLMLSLLVDSFLTQLYPQERVRAMEYVRIPNRRGSTDYAYAVIRTEHSRFRAAFATELQTGDQLRVFRTPWFGQVRQVVVRTGQMAGSRLRPSNLYDNQWPLPLLLTLAALLTLWPRLRPDRVFNVGLVCTGLLVLILGILYF